MNYKYILTAVLIVAVFSGTASAWLSGYDHRIAITVNNGGASELSYYQFNFTNDTNVLVAAGNMQASGADCRITDASDNLLPFWNETPFNAAGTKIWVNATTLAVGDNTFYMYYGNPSASSASNGTNTFEFFDDFEYTGFGLAEIWDSGTIGTGTQHDTARNILIDGNYLYALSSSAKKLVIYDISNPNSPVQKSLTSTTYNNVDIRGKKGDYIFVSNLDGVDIWNVSNVSSPSLNNHISFGAFVHGMFLSGDYLYCCMHEIDKFQIIDVLDPTNPVNKGNLSGATYFNGVHDVYVDGNYAYVANYLDGAGQYGFVVVNISDKDNLSVAAYSGEGHTNSAILKVGNYCYVGSHEPDVGITIYDVSIPTSPSYKGRFLESYGVNTGYWCDIYNSFTIGLIAPGSDKLILIDISTPDSPTVSRDVSTTNNPKSVAISGDYFFVSIEDWSTYNWCIKNYKLADADIGSLEKWTAVTGTMSLDNVIKHSGSYSMKVPSGGNLAKSNYAFSSQDVVVNFWMSCAETGGDKAYLVISDPDDHSPYPMFVEFEGGTIYYYSSSSTISTGVSYTADDMHEFKVILYPSTSTFDLYVDTMDTPIVTGAAWGAGTGMANCTLLHQGDASYPADSNTDDFRVRKYASPEPAATLGAEETGGGGCGAYNITLPLGWSIIGWTNPTASTAHSMGGLIGSNCTYVTERNSTTGMYATHVMSYPPEHNFAIERGWGYFVSTTAETLWERDS